MLKTLITTTFLLLASPIALAVEAGLYRQLQDPTCFQAVQLIATDFAAQMAFVQFAGSCTGSAMLFCEDNWCMGQDSDSRIHVLNPINLDSYFYFIDGDAKIYHRAL